MSKPVGGFGGGWGANNGFSAALLPVCVTYLLLDACEIGRWQSGCSLGVQNSNWNKDEHMWLAKARCIYVARF